MCYGIGGNFATTFGGGDADWMLDTSGEAVNASARLANMGITMDNAAAMGMLFGAPGDDLITGSWKSAMTRPTTVQPSSSATWRQAT